MGLGLAAWAFSAASIMAVERGSIPSIQNQPSTLQVRPNIGQNCMTRAHDKNDTLAFNVTPLGWHARGADAFAPVMQVANASNTLDCSCPFAAKNERLDMFTKNERQTISTMMMVNKAPRVVAVGARPASWSGGRRA